MQTRWQRLDLGATTNEADNFTAMQRLYLQAPHFDAQTNRSGQTGAPSRILRGRFIKRETRSSQRNVQWTIMLPERGGRE